MFYSFLYFITTLPKSFTIYKIQLREILSDMHISKLLVFVASIAMASPVIETGLARDNQLVKDDVGSLERRKHSPLSKDSFIYKRPVYCYFISLADNS